MWKIIFAVLSIPLMFVGNDCGGGSIKITEAWTHASAPDATTAEVYLNIHNTENAADTLTTVTTYASETTVIMVTEDEDVDGQHVQKEVPNLNIEGNKDIALRKNRTYILLKKLRQPLVAGEKFPITLTFAKAGQVLEDVIIQPAGTITYGFRK